MRGGRGKALPGEGTVGQPRLQARASHPPWQAQTPRPPTDKDQALTQEPPAWGWAGGAPKALEARTPTSS